MPVPEHAYILHTNKHFRPRLATHRIRLVNLLANWIIQCFFDPVDSVGFTLRFSCLCMCVSMCAFHILGWRSSAPAMADYLLFFLAPQHHHTTSSCRSIFPLLTTLPTHYRARISLPGRVKISISPKHRSTKRGNLCHAIREVLSCPFACHQINGAYRARVEPLEELYRPYRVM